MTDRQPAVDPEEATAATRTKAATGRRAGEIESTREPGTDELPWIDDRVSKLWVVLIVGIFTSILLFGVLFGSAGLLAPAPSPSPLPTQTPVISPTPRATSTPSSSPAASPSGAPSPRATAPASTSPAGSPSPDGS